MTPIVRCLTEVGTPMTDIALAAGFGSLRRFNSVFRATYHGRVLFAVLEQEDHVIAATET